MSTCIAVDTYTMYMPQQHCDACGSRLQIAAASSSGSSSKNLNLMDLLHEVAFLRAMNESLKATNSALLEEVVYWKRMCLSQVH